MSEPRQRKNFPKPQPEPLCTSSEKFSTGDRAGNPSLVWLQTLSAFPEPSISCLNVRRGKTPLNHNPNHCVHHQPPEKFNMGKGGNPIRQGLFFILFWIGLNPIPTSCCHVTLIYVLIPPVAGRNRVKEQKTIIRKREKPIKLFQHLWNPIFHV